MKVHWSNCGPREANFGDKLTPLLLRHFGVSCEWSEVESADLIGVGSILDYISDSFGGVIWTTGLMHESSRKHFEHASLAAVRGKLTRERVGSSTTGVLAGDGGLLCDQVHAPRRKRYKLGVIPHYVDADDPSLIRFAASSSEIFCIDICADTMEVIRAIGQCEYIISSALHGLIAADSFGIPNRWIQVNRGPKDILGRDFKYLDYYSIYEMKNLLPDSIGPQDDLDCVLSRFGPYSRPGIETIKAKLLESLMSILVGQPRVSRKQLRLQRDHEAAISRQERYWPKIATDEILALIPAGEKFIFINEAELHIPNRHVLSFVEQNEEHYPLPKNDEIAIRQLQCLHSKGAKFFVITWRGFWWVDYYPTFWTYLEKHFPRIASHESLIVFDLR